MMTSSLLRADAASFRYRNRPLAVGPFELAVGSGEIHLVKGPSGSGKSTLARLLAGTIPHLYAGDMGGRIVVDGTCSSSLPLWRLADSVGLVAQNPAKQLFTESVRHEINFGLEHLGLRRSEAERRLALMLDRFALHHLSQRDPKTLSGGEQQRVLLAAIAARAPRALVLDEPLSMLDFDSTRALTGHLEEERRQGTAIVVFEHRTAVFDGIGDVHGHALPAPPSADEPLPQLPPIAPFRISLEKVSVEMNGRFILRGICADMRGGEVIAVSGPNGAGKTTLLRALSGLTAHAGTITVNGSKPAAMHMGLCFQNPDRQIFNATVREEVLYGTTGDSRYRPLLTLLGLDELEDVPPLLLSEGQKKRLALATLLLRPGLCGICLDEPTLGQDDAHRRTLGRVVRHLAAAGYLCIVATHDRAWAGRWCDRRLVLQHGEMIDDESIIDDVGPLASLERESEWSRGVCAAVR
jgi:energy-coupling factor transport system ATP-binding protein